MKIEEKKRTQFKRSSLTYMNYSKIEFNFYEVNLKYFI